MTNTTVFHHFPASFQFLHICHYINSIGLIISNDTTSDKQYQTIFVLNVFFEYLNQSDNETEAKQILLQKVLKGTDLYGGDEDESLDTEYIDKTYHYIINKALFSQYGGVTGYLASIVNKQSNLNYNYFKITVKHHFTVGYESHDPCSSNNSNTKLSFTARTKIFEDYVWSIFPQPEQDLNITDINYIYAMAGYKIVKTLPIMNQLNLRFDEYIHLARTAEITALQNKSYHLVLEFFSTPALFFYASREKVKFQEQNLTSLNAEFWNDAYQMLFSYLNETVEMLVQDALKNSLHYKLQNDIFQIKNRTELAEMILKAACPNVTDSLSLKYLIYRYKSKSVAGPLLLFEIIADMMDYGYFNCSNKFLPNLNQLFYAQFDNVRNTYYKIEKNSIQQALAAGGLLHKINSPNASVEKAKLPDLLSFCNPCGPNQRSIKEDIYFFFAINQDSETEFYAFKQEENTLTLIKNKDNEKDFARALGVDSSIKPQTKPISIFLKKQQENSTVFVERLAKIKTDQYVSLLQEYYYEPTLVEKVMNYFLSLVPFYTCVSDINSGKAAEAVLSCSLDIMSLVPIAEVATKYLTLIRSSFTFQIGKAFTAMRVVSRGGVTSQVAIRSVISEIFQAARTVTSELLTQPIIRDLSIALIRTMDPGFEIVYSLSRYGIRFLWKLLDKILLHAKSIFSFGRFSDQLKLTLSSLRWVTSKNVDHTGMVPKIIGREPGLEVVRYTYPAGINFFGPKCLKVFGHTAEMRTIFEDMRQIPVVPSKIDGDTVHYKKIDLDTGILFDYELMLDNNDLLRRIKNSVKLMGLEALGNQVRNYDVYYNTVDKNQSLKRKIVLESREDAASSTDEDTNQEGALESEKGDKTDTSLQENQRVDSKENDLDYQPGPSQKKKFLIEKRNYDKSKSDNTLGSNVLTEKDIQTNLKNDEESGFDIDSFIAERSKGIDKYDLEVPDNSGLGIEQARVVTEQKQSEIDWLRKGTLQKKEVEALGEGLKVQDKDTRGREVDFEYNVLSEKGLETNLKYVKEPDTSLQENQRPNLEESDINYQAGPSEEKKVLQKTKIDNKSKSDTTLGSNVPVERDIQTNLKNDDESGFDIDSFIEERSKGIDKYDFKVQDSSGLGIQQFNVATEQKQSEIDLLRKGTLQKKEVEALGEGLKAQEKDTRGREVDLEYNAASKKGLETNLKHVKEPDTSLQENQRPNLEESDINYQAGPSQEKKVLLETEIDDKSKSDTTLGSNVPVERDIQTNIKNDEESGFDLDSFFEEWSKGIDKYDLEVQDNSGLGIEQVRIEPEQEQSGIDLLRKGNTQRKEVEAQGVELNVPNEGTRVSGMNIDENLSKLPKPLEKHDSNLQKSYELVEGATGQQRDTIATGDSQIEAQEPDFDIDKFAAERAEQLNFNSQQENEDLRSLPNSMKVLDRKNNFKIILKDMRSWRLKHEEELNFGSNPSPMTDFNTVAIITNQFKKLGEYRHYYTEVRRAADMYTYFDKINQMLSFNDYLLLWLQVMKNFPLEFEVNGNSIVATYRLALKQSLENWINEPIKLYRFRGTTMDVIQVYEKFKKNAVVRLSNFILCSDKFKMHQITWETPTNVHPILFEMTLSNQYGVADIERIMPVEGLHAIPSGMEFRVDNIVRVNFRDMSILKVKLSDSQITPEMKLSNVQHKLQILN